MFGHISSWVVSTNRNVVMVSWSNNPLELWRVWHTLPHTIWFWRKQNRTKHTHTLLWIDCNINWSCLSNLILFLLVWEINPLLIGCGLSIYLSPGRRDTFFLVWSLNSRDPLLGHAAGLKYISIWWFKSWAFYPLTWNYRHCHTSSFYDEQVILQTRQNTTAEIQLF